MTDIKLEEESGNLQEFLTKIKADDYLIIVDAEGMKVSAVDKTQVLFQNVSMGRNAFVKHPAIETPIEVPIEDHTRLLNFVKRFKGKIQVTIGDKVLVMCAPNSTYNLVLAAKGVVTTVEQPKKVAFDTFINAKTDFFQEAIKDAVLMGDPLFEFETKGGELAITTTNNVDKAVQTMKCEYTDAKAKYGEYVRSIFETLTGNVELGFKSDFPMMVKHKSKTVKTVYILAPYVEEEAKKEAK